MEFSCVKSACAIIIFFFRTKAWFKVVTESFIMSVYIKKRKYKFFIIPSENQVALMQRKLYVY